MDVVQKADAPVRSRISTREAEERKRGRRTALLTPNQGLEGGVQLGSTSTSGVADQDGGSRPGSNSSARNRHSPDSGEFRDRAGRRSLGFDAGQAARFALQIKIRRLTTSVTTRLLTENVKLRAITTLLAMVGLVFGMLETSLCAFECRQVTASVDYLKTVPALVRDWCELFPPDLESTPGHHEVTTHLRLRPESCGARQLSMLALRSFTTLSTLVCVALLFRYHQNRTKAAKIHKHVTIDAPLDAKTEGVSWRDRLFDIQEALPFCLEAILLSIHIPPGVFSDNELEFRFNGVLVQYRLADLFTLAMTVRIYLFWVLFIDYQMWRNSALRFVAQGNDLPLTSGLIVKLSLQRRTSVVTAAVFCLTTLIGGHWMRISEQSIQHGLANLWTCAWMIVVSMTSTGYGDHSPVTVLGRAVAVVCMLVGRVLESLLVATIFDKLAFTAEQQSTMNFMSAANWATARKERAVQLLCSWWREGLHSIWTQHKARQQRFLNAQFRKWMVREPHLGKVLADIAESVVEIDKSLDLALKQVTDLSSDSADVIHEIELRKKKAQQRQQRRAEVGEEEEEDDVENQFQRDLGQLQTMLKQHEVRMTKLIRAADTLGRHYKQDYGEMTGELASLQPHASPCVEVQSLVGKAKRGNVDTQEKPTGV